MHFGGLNPEAYPYKRCIAIRDLLHVRIKKCKNHVLILNIELSITISDMWLYTISLYAIRTVHALLMSYYDINADYTA